MILFYTIILPTIFAVAGLLWAIVWTMRPNYPLAKLIGFLSYISLGVVAALFVRWLGVWWVTH